MHLICGQLVAKIIHVLKYFFRMLLGCFLCGATPPHDGELHTVDGGDQKRHTDAKGRLGPLWRFPSDHLPVGCEISMVSERNFRLVSWNVMSSRFPISNLEGQGLKGSLCWEQYKRKGHGSNCKLRDCVVLSTLAAFIQEGPAQADVLCLQEMTRHVLKKLRPLLIGCGWGIVGEEHFDDAVILHRRGALRLLNDGVVTPFSTLGRGSGTRALRLASFCTMEGGECFRVVSGKIPGNPSGIHLTEAAHCFVGLPALPEGGATLFLGDFNFLGEEITTALKQAGAVVGTGPALVSSDDASTFYATNMSPALVPPGFGGGPWAPKRIDHVIASGLGKSDHLRLLPAAQLLPGLEEEVKVLLRSGQPHAPEPLRKHQLLWERETDLVLREISTWQASVRLSPTDDGPPTLW